MTFVGSGARRASVSVGQVGEYALILTSRPAAGGSRFRLTVTLWEQSPLGGVPGLLITMGEYGREVIPCRGPVTLDVVADAGAPLYGCTLEWEVVPLGAHVDVPPYGYFARLPAGATERPGPWGGLAPPGRHRIASTTSVVAPGATLDVHLYDEAGNVVFVDLGTTNIAGSLNGVHPPGLALELKESSGVAALYNTITWLA